jgi:hypothetical protein
MRLAAKFFGFATFGSCTSILGWTTNCHLDMVRAATQCKGFSCARFRVSFGKERRVMSRLWHQILAHGKSRRLARTRTKPLRRRVGELLEARHLLATIAFPPLDPVQLQTNQVIDETHAVTVMVPANQEPIDFVRDMTPTTRNFYCNFWINAVPSEVATENDPSLLDAFASIQLLDADGNSIPSEPMEIESSIYVENFTGASSVCPTLRLIPTGDADVAIEVSLHVFSEAEPRPIPVERWPDGMPPADPGIPTISAEGDLTDALDFTLLEDFSAASLPADWQINSTHPNGLVSVKEGIDGPSLWLETLGPDPHGPSLHGALTLTYDADTGNLQVATQRLPFTTLLLRSTGRLFGGQRPAELTLHGFDVFLPSELFLLRTRGIEHVDFGPVLPTGLDLATLASDLVITGSNLGGGPLGSPIFRYADDPLETPLGAVVVDAILSLHGEISASSIVEFDYRFTESSTNPAIDDFFGSSLQSGISVSSNGGNHWRTVMPLTACSDDVCSIRFDLFESHSNTTAPSELLVRLRTTISQGSLIVDNLRIAEPSIQSHWYAFNLDDLQSAEINGFNLNSVPDLISGEPVRGSLIVRLFDAQRNLISEFPVEHTTQFSLSGIIQPGETDQFLIELQGSARYHFGIEEMTTGSTSNRIDLRKGDSSTLSLGDVQNLDLRTCTLDDFIWDGPPLRSIDLISAFERLDLTTIAPIGPGEYTLSLADGSCLDRFGEPMEPRSFEVDYQPPELLDVTIKSQMQLAPGHHDLTFIFDETMQRLTVNGSLRIEGPLGQRRLFRPESPWLVTRESEAIFVPLGYLGEGSYRIIGESIDALDRRQNVTKLDDFVIEFQVVAPEAATIVDPFDVNRDGIRDLADMRLLQMALISPTAHPQFDTDGDGEFTALDLDQLVRQSELVVMGDVNLDGVFDQQDLDELRSIGYGERSSFLMGDFDGNGYFDTSDLRHAMTHGLFQGASSDDCSRCF